ncbi:MAG: ankyrin repeat domain-containing protein [Candidatus Amoebophilus sp.]
MKRNYTLSQQFIARLLLIGLCLQSCSGGFGNHPLIPAREEQIASIQPHAQAIPLSTHIEPLINQELTAQGGHLVTCYEEDGELKADIEMSVPQGFSKTYEGLAVYIEQGSELSDLPRLGQQVQQRRIHLQLAQGGKPAKVIIYKGAGLMGGMQEGEEEAEEGELDEDDMPHECFCPISLGVMKDPVIAQDGYSYERAEIVKWVNTTDGISPLNSNIYLNIATLMPNLTLRKLINDLRSSLAERKLEMRHIEETLAQKGQLIEKESKEKLKLAAELAAKDKELAEQKALLGVIEQRLKVLEEQAKSSKLREEKLEERLMQKERLVKKESQERLRLETELQQKETELEQKTALLGVMDQRIKTLEQQASSFSERDNQMRAIILQMQQCMGHSLSGQLVSSSSSSSSTLGLNGNQSLQENNGLAKPELSVLENIENEGVRVERNIKKEKEKLRDEDQGEEKTSNRNIEQASIKIYSLYTQVIKEEGQRIRSFIDSLLNSDFLINGRDDKGNTALHLAIRQANIFLNERLKEFDIDIHRNMSSTQYLAVSTIRKAYVPAISELLLKDSSAVNVKDKYGCTPLHLAAWIGNEKLINLLLEKGADVNAKKEDGNSPLHTAARWVHTDTEIVKLLLEKGADINAKDRHGETPLCGAILFSQLEIVKLLLEKGADGNAGAPLYSAALNNREEVAALLLEKCADIEIESKNEYKWNLLHWAAWRGHLEVAKLLIEKGADINAKNDNGTIPYGNGNSPLHTAVGMEHVEIVKLLIDAGADVNIKNDNDNSPLHTAVEMEHVEIVKLLLEKGADVNAKNDNDNSSLHRAARRGHLEIAKLLIEKGADVNAKNEDGDSPLYEAASNGHLEVVKLLLEKGVDVNAKGYRGYTQLHIAVRNIDIVNLLIEKGADVNIKNEDGDSPLHKAASNGHLEVVKLLLEKGADINAKDRYGKTPIDIARQREYKALVNLLTEKLDT